MSLITRTYTFTDNTVAYGSQVDSEIQNIVNTINSLDAGTTTWDNVKLAVITPTANLNFSSYRLTNIGTPTTNGDALSYGHGFDVGSNKITSLTNGSASSDAAAFGQIPVFVSWTNYTPTVTGCGTISNTSFWYKQWGDSVSIRGYFTTGTCTAATVTVTIPGAYSINTAHMSGSSTALCGMGQRLLAAAGPTQHDGSTILDVYANGASTTAVFLTTNTGGGVFSAINGSNLFTNGDSCTVNFDFAI